MVTTKEISEVFKQKGIKTHRLFNKEISKWNDNDFREFKRIKTGLKEKNNTNVKVRVRTKLKKVIRISDGKEFDSVKICSEKTGITVTRLYTLLNEKKESSKIFKYK